jgi:hypothetical protein
LSFALSYQYLDFEVGEVQDRIITAITPFYDAWVNHFLGVPGLPEQLAAVPPATPATVPSIEVIPPVTVLGDLNVAASSATVLNVAVPEPSTWWLAAVGAAWLLRRRAK